MKIWDQSQKQSEDNHSNSRHSGSKFIINSGSDPDENA